MSFTTDILAAKAVELQNYLTRRQADRAAKKAELDAIDADIASVQAHIAQVSSDKTDIEVKIAKAQTPAPANAVKT